MACPRSQSPLEAELGLTPRALLEPRASPLLGVPKARWLVGLPSPQEAHCPVLAQLLVGEERLPSC